ncbi:DUF11 domain-containing protein [Asanoa sp. NPDC049573]|uniref:DUF11 domain-containing protein n=1 Tax=Asanoa sp. NPDC049573 TaxID=3155396 RepID=UPI003419B0B8
MRWFRFAAASLLVGLLLVLPAPALAVPLPATANIAVTGHVTPAVVKPGRDATLTVTARNAGFLPATGVRVAVPLPSRLTVTRATADHGAFDGLVWTVGALPVGAAAKLTLLTRGAEPTTVTAAAALVASTPVDGDQRDDLATAPLRIDGKRGRADLALAARVEPAAVPVGTPVSYAVTITNKGPDPAAGVEVADPVLTGSVLTSATSAGTVTGPAPGGGPVATAARWRVGTLAAGASATWTVHAPATLGWSGSPRLLVTQSSADDPVAGDNVARVAPTVAGADLTLTRDVSNLTPVLGGEVEVTLTASNAGPDPAHQVIVADPPGRGLEFVSARYDAGRYDEESGRWEIGDLAAGAEATLRLLARVAATGRLPSRATIQGTPADPDGAGNAVETVLTASGDPPAPAPVFRSGFPLPYTQIRLSTMEASIVGGLLIAGGLVLLFLRTPPSGGAWSAASPGRRSRRPGPGRHAAPARSR